jgi:hypothetical protein
MSGRVHREELRTTDQLCDEFEAECQAGRRPVIESYLACGTVADRAHWSDRTHDLSRRRACQNADTP